MKKYFIILNLLLLLSACKKESRNISQKALLQINSLEWLQDKIAFHDSISKQPAENFRSFSAWVSYKYNNAVFYEYDYIGNNLEAGVYDALGKKVEGNNLKNYQTDKCCKTILWQGSNYKYLRPYDNKPTLKRLWLHFWLEQGLGEIEIYRPFVYNTNGLQDFLVLLDDGMGKISQGFPGNGMSLLPLTWSYNENTKILELQYDKVKSTDTGSIIEKVAKKYQVLELTTDVLKMKTFFE